MAIKLFILLIIGVSIFLTNFDIKQEIEEKKYKNIPKIVFYDSIMYDINEKNVKQIVQSKQLLNYTDRDEMYDATILKRNTNNLSDSISAEYMVKKKDDYRFYQNVVVNRKGGVQLLSEQLSYNDKNKILSNETKFVLSKNGSTLEGSNLYFNTLSEQFKAKETHFILKGIDK